MLSQDDLLNFMSLFAGAQEFYGTTKVGEIVNGKAESQSLAIHEVPGPSQFLGHLTGKASIGISPLKADNTVSFTAIDIDDYKGNLKDIITAIYHFNLPICPCYSKSRKLHLYFFFTQGTKAEDAVELMQWYRLAFACDPKTEIFPKQVARSTRHKAYSWINIPYYDSDNQENWRKMIGEDGESLFMLDKFLARANEMKMSIDEHWEAIKELEFYDAPPCILTGLMLRNVGRGGRNIWFYSLVVYLKLKDEDEQLDIEEEVLRYNSEMQDPLPEAELKGTVLSNLEGKTGFYACSQMPDRCNKKACVALQYGVGSKRATGLEYGQMKQILTDPPTYEWEISGKKLTFESEKDLLGQEKFRQLCLRELHIVPRPLDNALWSRILNKSVQNIQMQYVEETEGDLTAGSMFFDSICQYFDPKRAGTTLSAIAMGRIYSKDGYWYFGAQNILKYIQEIQGMREFKKEEIRKRLLDLGAFMENGLWKIPQDKVKSRMAALKADANVDINLSDGSGDSDDF